LYNPSLLKHAMKILNFMLDDIDESSADFAVATSVESIRKVAHKARCRVLCFQGLARWRTNPHF